MPIYMIERQFAELVEFTPEAVEGVNQINSEFDVDWLFSFLSADKLKTYCLYQAKNPEDLLRAAEKAGVPADKIVEVSKFDPREPLT